MSKDIVWFCVFLAIFMYGLTVMRVGLYNISGDVWKKKLILLTDHPIKGLLVGTFITAILQSSSAIMIITIGFVTAGMLTFKQSLGIMLGANIGTTITAEIMTINIGDVAVYIVMIGFVLLFVKNKSVFALGTSLFGLGCIFISMQGFTSLADSISSKSVVEQLLMYSNLYHSVAIMIGTILTSIIQSSSAVIGIAMGFLHNQDMTISSAIAIMLGANIGTCITAFFASIGAGIEAKRTAYAHIWLNIFGVALFFPFINPLAEWSISLASQPESMLAHASVIFNIICSLIALPFLGLFSRFITAVYR
ncbi:Na/Pi symporter [Bacillus salitolerans]|uniref:Na/Pi symporter n=1 Tax=Bacillus salitolerans TaxID=1437434 RepID=A0ABW4LN62_9BACI